MCDGQKDTDRHTDEQIHKGAYLNALNIKHTNFQLNL